MEAVQLEQSKFLESEDMNALATSKNQANTFLEIHVLKEIITSLEKTKL